MRLNKLFQCTTAVFFTLSLSILTYNQVYAATRNVPGTYASIQDAIDYAADGDVVFVDDGIYTENINYDGKAITVRSVNGANKTIIDGNASGSVVIFVSGETASSVLDGFTITNGSGTGREFTNGGGIYCAESSPQIINCTIENNTVTSLGGGIYGAQGASPTITNCNISSNSANSGGGVFCFSSTTITNCTIKNNTVTSHGSGIYCLNTSLATITNCIISGNSGAVYGGGIYCVSQASPTITNCIISNNSASHGGGISCRYVSSPTITNCTISKNSSAGDGGGLHCYYVSSPTVINCTISDNSSHDGGGIYAGGLQGSSPILTNCLISGNFATNGGAIYSVGDYQIPSSLPQVTNCTISNNTASSKGGAIFSIDFSYPMITNSILWGNVAELNDNEIHLAGGTITVTYSDVQGGYPGAGNIGNNPLDDPLFVDPANGNYHLSPDSPCIDIGTLADAPSDDFEGDLRPQGDGIDMGVDELSLLGTISGFITNADYFPIANALVKMRRNGATIDETYTTSKGHYEFRNVDQSGYGIVASKKGFKNNWALGFVSPSRKWSKNEFINLNLSPRN